jgi:hypothetical protein
MAMRCGSCHAFAAESPLQLLTLHTHIMAVLVVLHKFLKSCKQTAVLQTSIEMPSGVSHLADAGNLLPESPLCKTSHLIRP